MPSIDEYDNPVLFRLNAAEIFMNQTVASRDPTKFHYGAKTKSKIPSIPTNFLGIINFW